MQVKSRASLKMIIHQEKAFQWINNIHPKAKRKNMVNIMNLTGGSFDFMGNNLKEEVIIAHLLMRKNFMSMVEKILGLVT